MKIGDVVLLALLLLGIGGLFRMFWTAPVDAQTLRISSSQGSQSYSLKQDRLVHLHGPLGETVVEIKDGAARVQSSPCRQQICVRSGWHRRSGAVAACVPNRISLILSGGAQGELDALSY